MLDSGQETVLSLTPMTKKRDVSSSSLTVKFESPDLEREIDRLREFWTDKIEGSSRDRHGYVHAPKGSGLCFAEAGQPFLKAAEALENLIYFQDMLARNAGDVARFLGDLGVVLIASTLKPLLEEVRCRVVASERACQEVHNIVYGVHIERVRDRTSFRPSEQQAAARLEAEKAMSVINTLKARILSTIVDMQNVLDKYHNVDEVFEEGMSHITELHDRLKDPNTMRRTNRFASIEGLAPVLLGHDGSSCSGSTISDNA